MADTPRPAWDVFISHASEDKDSFVRPLATELSRLGLRVWYDEFSLRLGDGLRESIDKGLRDSASGLVIISPKFIEKPWPKRELEGLVAGIDRGQLIVPIWFNISRDVVYSFSPPLANTVAAIANNQASLPDLALKILERVKPELHQAFLRRRALEQWIKQNPDAIGEIDPKLINVEGPIRHQTFSLTIFYTIRIVREALLDVFPQSWHDTVDCFRMDMEAEDELSLWLYMTSIYLTVLNEFDLNIEERKKVFEMALEASMRESSTLPDDAPDWQQRTLELCEFKGDPLNGRFASIEQKNSE